MIVALVEAEIEHDAGTGGLEILARVVLADLAADELAIGADGIHVGDDAVVGDASRRLAVTRPVTAPFSILRDATSAVRS